MRCKCPALAEPHAADYVKRSARGEGCDKWRALSFVLSVESIGPLTDSYQLPNAEKEAKSTRSSGSLRKCYGRVSRVGLDVAKQLGARAGRSERERVRHHSLGFVCGTSEKL